MHPAFAEELVRLQLSEAEQRGDVFSDKVKLESFLFPVFYVEFATRAGNTRLLRFDCANYDFQPMDVDPVDPTTREPLRGDRYLRNGGGNFPGHQMRGGGPFLCVSGTRAYYTHESHRPRITGNRWEEHRVSMRIGDVLRHIAGKFASGAWE